MSENIKLNMGIGALTFGKTFSKCLKILKKFAHVQLWGLCVHRKFHEETTFLLDLGKKDKICVIYVSCMSQKYNFLE